MDHKARRCATCAGADIDYRQLMRDCERELKSQEMQWHDIMRSLWHMIDMDRHKPVNTDVPFTYEQHLMKLSSCCDEIKHLNKELVRLKTAVRNDR